MQTFVASTGTFATQAYARPDLVPVGEVAIFNSITGAIVIGALPERFFIVQGGTNRVSLGIQLNRLVKVTKKSYVAPVAATVKLSGFKTGVAYTLSLKVIEDGFDGIPSFKTVDILVAVADTTADILAKLLAAINANVNITRFVTATITDANTKLQLVSKNDYFRLSFAVEGSTVVKEVVNAGNSGSGTPTQVRALEEKALPYYDYLTVNSGLLGQYSGGVTLGVDGSTYTTYALSVRTNHDESVNKSIKNAEIYIFVGNGVTGNLDAVFSGVPNYEVV